MRIASEGSSPRVRGKLRRRDRALRRLRLIPACAGKTHFVAPRSRVDTAHPRVCGENPVMSIVPRSPRGSSSRVRGKHASPSTTLRYVRLIPACAGKTLVPAMHCRTVEAHPRVCGENSSDTVRNEHECGSSPRVRGKRPIRSSAFSTARLIPACAGKTCLGMMLAAARAAHPRVCGENPRTARTPA